jgi:hypothetical protein
MPLIKRPLAFLIAASACLSASAGSPHYTLPRSPLTQQQRSDIYQVTGRTSTDQHVSGDPFVEFIQLSTDNTIHVVVTRSLGGALSNVDLWIFQIFGDHATLLLAGAGSIYLPLETVHNGRNDFLTFWNLGRGSGTNEVYQFDGKSYWPAFCYDSTLGPADGDEKQGTHHPCKN